MSSELERKIYRERARSWRERNPKRAKEYAKRYYEKNKEKFKAHNRAYYEAHKERYHAYYAERKKRNQTLLQKLMRELSSLRINLAMFADGADATNDVFAFFEARGYFCETDIYYDCRMPDGDCLECARRRLSEKVCEQSEKQKTEKR